MFIGGLQKSSLIDYPEKISAIIFTQGCNFRCPYCHNPELIEKNCSPIPPPTLRWRDGVGGIIEFLKSRIGKLDGVVITGGEPTLHKDLPEFISKIKTLGFAVKLDTNGTNPQMLQELIDKKLIDYVAMDIKAPLDKYCDVVCANVDTNKVQQSIDILKNSNVILNSFQDRKIERLYERPCDAEINSARRESGFQYEFRTTVVKSQLSYDDFKQMGKMLNGAQKYYLQRFLPTKTLNRFFVNQTTYSDEEFMPIISDFKSKIDFVELR